MSSILQSTLHFFTGWRSLLTPSSIDLNRTLLWKEGIVDRLSGGVGVLLRKANVHVLDRSKARRKAS